MNKKTDWKRDGINDRLLLFIREKTGLPAIKMERIKKGVRLLITKEDKWIIKEFSSPEKFMNQVLFTDQLWEKGFKNTHLFHPIHRSGPLSFNNRWLGVLKYIEPYPDAHFHFGSARSRKDAIALLSHFHSVSEQCVTDFYDKLPLFQQINKWRDRLDTFKHHSRHLQQTDFYPYLSEYIKIGEIALQLMNLNPGYFLGKPHAILHGDLAHHNFIRDKDGHLFLIDFDLISIGPKQIDILQYCNRILPALSWSPEKLFSLDEAIGQYRGDFSFLAALLYPADIFREWNYIFRPESKKNWSQLKAITFSAFEKRMKFSKWIIDRFGIK